MYSASRSESLSGDSAGAEGHSTRAGRSLSCTERIGIFQPRPPLSSGGMPSSSPPLSICLMRLGGEPQYPGSLINRVEALLHTGILPLEWGFALVIRRQLRSFKPSLGIFREMTVLGDRVDKRSWGAVKQPLHLR